MKTQQALLLVSLGLVAIVAAAPWESALRPSDANGREAAEIKASCFGDWICTKFGDCCQGVTTRKKLIILIIILIFFNFFSFSSSQLLL